MVAFGGSSQYPWNLSRLSISHNLFWYGVWRLFYPFFRAVTNLMRNQGFNFSVGLQPLGREMQTTPTGTIRDQHRKRQEKTRFIIVNLKVNLNTWQGSMAKQQWQQSAEPSAGLWLLGKCHSQRWVGLVGEWPAAQASVRFLKLGTVSSILTSSTSSDRQTPVQSKNVLGISLCVVCRNLVGLVGSLVGSHLEPRCHIQRQEFSVVWTERSSPTTASDPWSPLNNGQNTPGSIFTGAKKLQKRVLTTQPASQYCTIRGFLRVSILQKRGCSIQALHQLAGATLIHFWAKWPTKMIPRSKLTFCQLLAWFGQFQPVGSLLTCREDLSKMQRLQNQWRKVARATPLSWKLRVLRMSPWLGNRLEQTKSTIKNPLIGQWGVS